MGYYTASRRPVSDLSFLKLKTHLNDKVGTCATTPRNLALLNDYKLQLTDGSEFRGGVGSLNGRGPTYLLGREAQSVRRPSSSRAGLPLATLQHWTVQTGKRVHHMRSGAPISLRKQLAQHCHSEVFASLSAVLWNSGQQTYKARRLAGIQAHGISCHGRWQTRAYDKTLSSFHRTLEDETYRHFPSRPIHVMHDNVCCGYCDYLFAALHR
jgi:hypothetical protein